METHNTLLRNTLLTVSIMCFILIALSIFIVSNKTRTTPVITTNKAAESNNKPQVIQESDAPSLSYIQPCLNPLAESNKQYILDINWDSSDITSIDISHSMDFSSYFFKSVQNITTIKAPVGFYNPAINSYLSIEPDQEYYVRTWNGKEYSSVRIFNLPNCKSL